jgi:hypothetical protein
VRADTPHREPRAAGVTGAAAASVFEHYRGEVEVMLSYGCALGTIEGVVDRLPLDSDQRAALWLLAWSLDENPDGEPLAAVERLPV